MVDLPEVSAGSLAGTLAPPVLPVQVGEVGIAVYRHAVRRGRVTAASAARELALDFDDAERACVDLLSLRLLSEEPDGGFSPVHPDLARSLWTERLFGEIEARRQAIELNDLQLRRVAEALVDTTAEPGTDGFRTVDAGEVDAEVQAALLTCTEEVVSAQPGGPRWESNPAESLPADLALLRRGVARRWLYQHTARANLGMASYVSQLASHGGQVRTTPDGLERILIFDRRTAMIPHTAAGWVVITHRPVVDLLYRGFERNWSRALPFESEAVGYDEVSMDIRLSLLRLMAGGLKDDAIAHRLGMATRTCRRHISAIMASLGATSRFQAGVKAAQLRLLPADGELVPPQGQADSYPWW